MSPQHLHPTSPCTSAHTTTVSYSNPPPIIVLYPEDPPEAEMDDQKWQFCCCRITTGVQMIAVVEGVISVFFMGVLVYLGAISSHGWSWQLLLLAAALQLCNAVVVIVGVSLERPPILSFSLATRTIALLIVQACGLSGVLRADQSAADSAHLLVAAVFGLLFFVLVSIYIFYLTIRCTAYIRQRIKQNERRNSFIEAAIQEEMNYESRRPSADNN